MRYQIAFGKRWDWAIRGDVGVGDTDVSWNALTSFGVRLGKTDLFNLRLGWHHMELDVTADDDVQNLEIESDTTLTGPFFAFAMKF